MLLRNIILTIFCLAFMGCVSKDEDNSMQQQAGKIHLEAVQINKSIQPTLEKMKRSKRQLELEEEMTAQENDFLRQVKQIERSYAYWKENHVEVPGFEHKDHHHDHNHDTNLDVSSEDMLLIQQEFKDSIFAISARLENLRFPKSLSIHH